MSDLSYPEAKALTESIQAKARTIQDNIERLAALVTRAKDGNAWSVLGYASWTAYVVDVLGSDPLELTRSERKKLVGVLIGEGMSTRAIAPVVGVHHDTVAEDAKATVGKSDSRPRVTGLDGRERPATQSRPPANVDAETGEVVPPPSKQSKQSKPDPLTSDETRARLDAVLADDAELAESAFRARLAKAIQAASTLALFDPARVFYALDNGQHDDLDDTISGLAAWHRQVKTAHLKVVR